MIIQLNPPLPICTPEGKGLAHLVIDDGIEHHLKWVVFLDDNGECWTFQNPEIRIQKNITHGREHISPFYDSKDYTLGNVNEKMVFDDLGIDHSVHVPLPAKYVKSPCKCNIIHKWEEPQTFKIISMNIDWGIAKNVKKCNSCDEILMLELYEQHHHEG